MAKFNLGGVLVQDNKRVSIHPNALDGINTSVSDGGYNVQVTAMGANSVTPNSVMFTGVILKSDHPDHGDLPISSLKDVAREILHRNYVK